MKIEDIQIGWDMQDITPERPVELIGQYYQRISKGVRDPLAVTALAFEQRTASGLEQAVMASVDIIYVTRDFQEEVRELVRAAVPDLDPARVVLNATHIHSGPAWFAPFRWWVPAAGVMQPDEVRAFLSARVARAVENAWKARRPGLVSDAGASAASGFCRRTLYRDGSAMMYGETNRDDFIGMESGSDPEVRLLFTWDERRQLTGVIANVACPAQVMEAQYVVSADYFGELRRRIRGTYGAGVCLLAQVSAAGDQSPRNLPVQAKSEINYWDEGGVCALAGRLERVVAECYAGARDRADSAPVLRHEVDSLELPVRRVSLNEYRAGRAEVERLSAGQPDSAAASQVLFERFVTDTHRREALCCHGPFDDKELDFVQLENAQAVVGRFESQGLRPAYLLEIHAIRLGDCVFVTNPFELYLDYGQVIQARSRARRTFVVQLAGDEAGYLPTARAVATGGYGSLVINGVVGPEGGRMLVDASVRAIGRLWDEKAEWSSEAGRVCDQVLQGVCL